MKPSMVPRTLEEQLALLQRMGTPEWARKSAVIASLIGLGLVGYAIYEREFFFAILAFMLAPVAFSVRETGRHMQRAAKAWRQGRASEAVLDLSKDTSGDSESWYGEIEHKGNRWKIEFVAPVGWNASPGKLNVKIYSLYESPWPALFIAPQGLLFPRSTPKNIEKP